MEDHSLQACEQGSGSKLLGKEVSSEKYIDNYAQNSPSIATEPVESLTITESNKNKNQNLQENIGSVVQISTLEEAMQKLVHVELEGVDVDDEFDHFKQNRNSQENFVGPVDQILTLEEALQKLVHVKLEGVDDDDDEFEHFKQNQNLQENFVGPVDQISTLEEAMQKLVHVELEGVDDDDEFHFKQNHQSQKNLGTVDPTLKEALRERVHAEFEGVDDDNKRGPKKRVLKKRVRALDEGAFRPAKSLFRTKRRRNRR